MVANERGEEREARRGAQELRSTASGWKLRDLRASRVPSAADLRSFKCRWSALRTFF